MAKNNAKVYGVEDKIKFICGDFFEEVSKINANCLFLSLPWGGPDYKEIKCFKLSDFQPDGNKVLDIAFKQFKKIALFAPKNIDIDEIESLNKKFEVENNILYNKIIAKTIYFF